MISKAIGIRVMPTKYSPSDYEVIVRKYITKGTIVTSEFAKPTDTCKEILLEVYEGNDAVCANNVHLGHLVLDNVSPGPAGKVRVLVHLHLDEK